MNGIEQKTILVVDDNPTNIKVLFDFLRNSGFKVLVAKDGENALSKLAEVTPDLILLDVMMPGIDGFETCRRIKDNIAIQMIPVIFMTALSDTEHKVKGLSLGGVDYITKPFQQEEVLARINMHLKLHFLTKELAKKNAQLSELNTSLQEKVEERTAELKKAQSHLVLHEKMSSLGQLVAGIAHEINNPLSFISGNLKYANDYAQDLINLIKLYQKYYPEPEPEIADEISTLELSYLVEDFPQLIASMREGTNRITQISQSMRTFSRADSDAKVLFNIHEGLDSTLLILKHRLKASEQRPAIEVIKEYGDFPEIECYPGQLNQVFMNLLANAIDALEESDRDRTFAEIEAQPSKIAISTEIDPNTERVIIRIQDNGIGMTAEIKQKVFDYLFTTKSVGQGTGLGLSIARQIVEDKHGGKISCNSILGQGTEFTIALPK
ncbi:hybrid sensor histidine kinase/response regulator [Argonema antarcticum]|uniref:hybrid sensor histidine kinase/response regulator n=1 Tax=Argonema antarcticum TaxID=2942763 RepID=UPI0020123C25|nr:response regulator [Argonema antarcticum]MCL1470673.1 hybrid sensor histidine kinase/response regulator [Argonema antarcticum A004/B2]